MADAADSKSAGGNIVWVQVPPSALNFVKSLDFSRLFCYGRPFDNIYKCALGLIGYFVVIQVLLSCKEQEIVGYA